MCYAMRVQALRWHSYQRKQSTWQPRDRKCVQSVRECLPQLHRRATLHCARSCRRCTGACTHLEFAKSLPQLHRRTTSHCACSCRRCTGECTHLEFMLCRGSARIRARFAGNIESCDMHVLARSAGTVMSHWDLILLVMLSAGRGQPRCNKCALFEPWIT